MLAASILGTWSIWTNESRLSPLRGILAWAVVGILFAFVVMGAWSVGFLFIPVTVLFAIVAILSDRRHGHNLIVHLGISPAAALAQATLMLVVIHLL
jgi:asparagine N-glycosylation enzyme membrane subunit Stt3